MNEIFNVNPNLKGTIKDWERKISRSVFCHYESSKHLGRRNIQFGVAAIVVSTIAGTGILISTIGEFDYSKILAVIMGLFSIFAATLATLQTFLKFSERAEKHRQAANNYSSMKRELEIIVVFPPKELSELETLFSKFQEKWDKLSKQSEVIHPNVWDKSLAEYSSEKFKYKFFNENTLQNE